MSIIWWKEVKKCWTNRNPIFYTWEHEGLERQSSISRSSSQKTQNYGLGILSPGSEQLGLVWSTCLRSSSLEAELEAVSLVSSKKQISVSVCYLLNPKKHVKYCASFLVVEGTKYKNMIFSLDRIKQHALDPWTPKNLTNVASRWAFGVFISHSLKQMYVAKASREFAASHQVWITWYHQYNGPRWYSS